MRGWARVVVPTALAALAAVVRIGAADRISFQVDEQFSLLGARSVVDRGVPVLPSGEVYLHGTTLSYLLAPIAAHRGDLADLHTLRLVVAMIGTVAVVLAYGLACEVTGSTLAAMLVAVAMALDPLSVEWSAHVRMYAPLQALVLGLVWVTVRLLRDGPTRPRLAGFVVLGWLAVFTHVAAVLVIGAAGVVTLAVHGRALVGAQRALSWALVAAGAAVPALLALNRLGPSRIGEAGSTVRVPFVGDHLLRVRRVLEPDLSLWTSTFSHGAFREVLPPVVALASGVLLGRLLSDPTSDARVAHVRRAGAVVLTCYWLPVLVGCVFTVEPQARYLVDVHPLAFVVVGTVGVLLAQDAHATRSGLGRVGLAAVLMALVLVQVTSGLRDLAAHPVVDADYVATTAYVAARQRPGEPVVVALPAVAYLGLPDRREDIRFLAGPEDGRRVQRYTMRGPDGTPIDRWTASAAIGSTAALCQLLRERPDAWLLIDSARIRASWAYAGPMGDVLANATRVVYRGDGGAIVARPLPVEDWGAAARRACGR